jgi:signal transduction histidine kinase
MPVLISDGRIVTSSTSGESESPSADFIEHVARKLALLHPSRELTVALALLITLAAICGDAVTSAATTFTLFYVLALAIGTWFAGIWTGYLITVLAVVGSTTASLISPSHVPSLHFLLWNGALDLPLYVGCVRVLWALRERLEREVLARQDALGQLRHAERLTTIGKLAAGVAYEIGTPLNVISGRTELIAAGTMSPEAIKSSAKIVLEQTERVAVIIRQLLDFARRGGTEVTRTDVTDLIETTCLLLAPIARKARVELLRSGTHLEANLNRNEMQQVITNLITNAIHASHGGGKVEIGTRLEKTHATGRLGGDERPHAVLEVRDHGTGIAPDVLPKVFDPFFTTKDLGQGTGLGLSVAYGIVRDHHGWIAIDTTLGEGTTVTVYIPQ